MNEALSGGQLGFFIGYGVITVIWIYAEYVANKLRSKAGDVEEGRRTPGSGRELSEDEGSQGTAANLWSLTNPVTNVALLKHDALIESRDALKSMAEFGAHLIFYYACDRGYMFPDPSTKSYSRDVFWFIYFILIAYTVATSLTKSKASNYLNRDQTEEWKGWMQVLFLMYHYFDAREQYNSIRLYIAAYVWMTGFGNYSFYYVRKDFSPSRFFQMLWRLNFLVFWVCVVMNNDYMLYYICPMHTIWTIAVYLLLLVGKDHNHKNVVILLKFIAAFIIVTILWDKELFYAIWSPLQWIVGYTDPMKPDLHPLHEWFFRSGLDRYVWIFGMMFAHFHPNVEKFLIHVDNMSAHWRWTVRFVGLLIIAAVVHWYGGFFFLEKRAYNASHPYTSIIPIGIYILLRNSCTLFREYHLAFFSWLGKITLETYIGQFHIWLHTGQPNAQPKMLLTIVPGYPLINFFVVTPLYIWISCRLFHLTTSLKAAILPAKDEKRLYRNLVLVVCTWIPFYLLGKVVHNMNA
eukprot:TRINITY_DN20613_c0_g2_i1.p1 TRINITY_DN20613_c0_g2~~TRINITY_DN20613_c0_g2_i1.p1  ORF type:complete len:535 (+),score=72.64 TRINITY_DN20613_c0_g2_i1:51-1607(+)